MADPKFGLVVFDDRLVPGTFSELGEGETFSWRYEEDGPEPGNPEGPSGEPVREIRPFGVLAQDRDVEVAVIRGGYPGRDGASVATRPIETRRTSPLGAADTEFMGWEDYCLVTDWSAPPTFDALVAWDPNGETGQWDNVIITKIPGTEYIVVSATVSTVNPPNRGGTWVYDTRTRTWLSGYDWLDSAGGVGSPIGQVWDAEGDRFLFWHGPGGVTVGPEPTFNQWLGYVSEDLCQTFGYYTRGYFDSDDLELQTIGFGLGEFPAATGPSRLIVSPAPGEDWLVFYRDHISNATNTTDAIQFATSDRLASARRITATGARIENAKSIDVARGRDAFVVCYITNPGSQLQVRLLPAASTPFEDATPIVVGSTSYTQCAICADDDGILYILSHFASDPPSNTDAWILYRSIDGGSTWQRFDNYNLRITEFIGQVVNFDIRGIACAGGQLHVVGFFDEENGTVPKGVGLWSFGGWSNVEADAGNLDALRTSRAGSGGPIDPLLSGNFPEPSLMWTPYALPEDLGWVAGGTGAAINFEPSIGGGGMEVNGQTQIWNFGSALQDNRNEVICHVKVQPLQLPTQDEAGANSAGGLRVALAADNGSQGVEVYCRVFSDKIDLYDLYLGGVRAEIDLTTIDGRYIHIRGYTRVIATPTTDARSTWWYRFEDEDRWTLIGDVRPDTSGTFGNSDLAWGHGTVGSGQDIVAVWQLAMVTYGSYGWGLDREENAFLTNANVTKGITFGRPLPGNAARFPAPDLTDRDSPAVLGTDHGYIAARNGPGYYGQRVILPVAHRFGIENASPFVSPSPRRPWQVTPGSITELVYDLGVSSERHFGEVLALVAINVQPYQWFVDVDQGGISWLQVAEARFVVGEGLSWDREGRWVSPRAGTAAVTRYIHENELVESGGWFMEDLFPASRIVRNTAGYWTDRAGVQKVSIEIEDGSSFGVSGTTGRICSGGGVHVFTLPATPTAYRYVRIRCFNDQVTPDGAYRGGILALGRVVGVGADPGWTWQRRVELTRELTRRTDQLLEIRESGPPRTTLTYAWPDGVILRDLNREDRAAEVAFPGFPGVGTEEDAHSIATQLLKGQLRQGQVPVVVVPQLPQPGTTLTDPYRWLYGRVLTDAHGITGVVGTEGVDEVVRVDGLTFEEIK